MNYYYTNIFIMLQVISLRTQIDKVATNVTSLHAQSNFDDSLTSSGQLKGKILSLLCTFIRTSYIILVLELVNLVNLDSSTPMI